MGIESKNSEALSNSFSDSNFFFFSKLVTYNAYFKVILLPMIENMHI